MAQDSKIEWTHHTANLWHGCTKVHAGCDHCYAETLSHRWGRDIWGNEKSRMIIRSVWNDLAKYQKLATTAGEMHRVFVGSMMDIFEKPMPLMDAKGNQIDGQDTGYLRSLLFQQIGAGIYPNLLFLFLTKRPSNINKYIPDAWKEDPPTNVMFGTSPVDQETANTLIPQLMKVAGKKFLSIEPLLGPLNITNGDLKNAYSVPTQYTIMNGRKIGIEWTDPGDKFIGLDWVIVGGESGHGARPMHPDWVRSLRLQCYMGYVPFFFKQWGEWIVPDTEDSYDTSNGRVGKAIIVSHDGTVHCFKETAGANAHVMIHVGKKQAGRVLDGKIHDDFPVA